MAHRRYSNRWLAEKEAIIFGFQAIVAIKAGDAEKAGALAMFAIRWAKRSLSSKAR